VSPLAWEGAPGALGRCHIHRRPLVRRAPENRAERAATEHRAEEARAFLGEDVGRPPIPTQSPRRTGNCPQCTDEIAAAAWAYLNGDEER
jgi:hypothetical protein